LTGWSFQSDGVATLDGEWEFHWSALLSPQMDGAPGRGDASGTIAVPGSWNAHRDALGKPVGPEGFATYQLRILLPSGPWSIAAPAPSPAGELAVYLPYVNISYELWIDGERLAANGVVGRER